MKITEGSPNPEGVKLAIILSRFNDFIGNQLLEGVLDCLKEHKIADENIELFKVPGAYEIPVAAESLAKQKKFDVIITLGAVIRGETPHFDYVASAASSGVLQVSIKHCIPVIFGVLTTDTIEQARERAETKALNKGKDFALAALEMADLLKKISK